MDKKKYLSWFLLACSTAAVPGASAADAPQLQEGLWEIHIHTVQYPDREESDSTVKICRDRAYDKLIDDLAKYRTGCTSTASTPSTAESDKITLSRTCKVGGSIIDTAATVSIREDAAHAEMRTSYTPAWGGIEDVVTTQDQKYLGQCPANVKPGTVLSAAKVTR